MTKVPLRTWIVATRNQHKAGEICAILGSNFKYLTLDAFPNAPTVVEDAPDFAGNASKKAVQLANWIAQHVVPRRHLEPWVLADDSGLEVDALDGAPGVHSARFAALDSGTPTGNSPDAENNAKLLRLLADVPLEKRTARFRCVIAISPVINSMQVEPSVCFSDEIELRTELFDGQCEGHIAFAPSGAGGFGYDPLFIPRGHNQSFGELGEEIKNGLSHRARALEKLRAWLKR
jgi:XTP/dITP diphosphohydrolase